MCINCHWQVLKVPFHVGIQFDDIFQVMSIDWKLRNSKPIKACSISISYRVKSSEILIYGVKY